MEGVLHSIKAIDRCQDFFAAITLKLHKRMIYKMAGVVVRKVESKADFKAFFEFPWLLYKDDLHWVPPLKSMRRDLLNKRKNPAWEYMEGDYFAAWRGDKIVGTITAHINHHHNEYHQEQVGWFGFFEVFDDQEAAAALLETAAMWVKNKGFPIIRGPQSFTTHDECGVLIENFTRPVILMPYNKPYYQMLIENAGFQKVMDTFSLYYDRQHVQQHNAVGRLDKLAERVIKRSNIVIRPINARRLKAEFVLFKEIYNAAWSKNWGFVPLTPKELDMLVSSLGMFFEPKLACFAEINGDPAGFMLTIPDLNQALKLAYPRPGVPELVSLARALWHWKLRPVIDWVRVPLMGVKEQYRNKGVELAMFRHILKALLPSRYSYMDCGWILESNHDMLGVLEGVGAPRYKTYRFYEKEL